MFTWEFNIQMNFKCFCNEASNYEFTYGISVYENFKIRVNSFFILVQYVCLPSLPAFGCPGKATNPSLEVYQRHLFSFFDLFIPTISLF